VVAGLALYPFAWLALFQVSSIHWFLPAGLRLGTLWLLPRRAWPAMAVIESVALLLFGLYREDFAFRPIVVAGAVLPWCLYALVLRSIGRHGRGTPPRKALPRLLVVGVGAAILNAILLTLIEVNRGVFPSLPSMLVSYAVGDLAGIVAVVPLMLVLHGQCGPRRVPWPALLAHGLVLVPLGFAALLIVSIRPVPHAPVFPMLLSLVPLFAIAYRFGWRQGAIAYSLLVVALVIFPVPLAQLWRAGELESQLAVAGCAALLLGLASDTQRAQREELSANVMALSQRSRQLVESANRIAATQEQERRRIGAELHDQLGQDMTAIATRLRVVERTAVSQEVRDGIASISLLLTDAHTHLREVINHLHPAVLDRFGLARAIAEGPFAEMLRDHGVFYSSRIQGKVDLVPEDVASAIYRICQEAATNCARHGCGGRVHIRLTLSPATITAELTLEIEDQAGAIAVDPDRPGRGLLNIHDRASAIGADYRFDPDSGTPRHLLRMWIPLPKDEQTGQGEAP
jgi:two-component system, NarL family, sensor histidine kinase FusK